MNYQIFVYLRGTQSYFFKGFETAQEANEALHTFQGEMRMRKPDTMIRLDDLIEIKNGEIAAVYLHEPEPTTERTVGFILK